MSGITTLISNKLLLDTNIIIYYFNGIITDSKIDQILKESFDIVTNNVDDFKNLDLDIMSVEVDL